MLRSTGSWWSSFEPYSALSGVVAGARVWVPGPLSATMNLYAEVHASVVGATVVDEPHSASHACLTPAQLHRHGGELPRGTLVVVAGDALAPALLAEAERHGLRVAHYYGAAELSFVAAGAPGRPLAPFPGVEVQARDGELWVRSPYLCEGYSTHEPGGPGALRRDDAGWATVGDLGEYDGHRVRVLGRPGHVITAGATVSLASVETRLAEVATAPLAVIGLPHPVLGGVLACVLTAAADRTPLARFARAELPPAQRPRRWAVLPELPVAASGKIDREALRTALERRDG